MPTINMICPECGESVEVEDIRPGVFQLSVHPDLENGDFDCDGSGKYVDEDGELLSGEEAGEEIDEIDISQAPSQCRGGRRRKKSRSERRPKLDDNFPLGLDEVNEAPDID